MRTRLSPRTLSLVPLFAALTSCYQGTGESPLPPAVTGGGDPGAEEARMPLGTSLYLEVADPQGKPISRARVSLTLPAALPPEGATPLTGPGAPAHLMLPTARYLDRIEYRTDSAGHLLLEELERFVGDRLVARVEAPGYAPASVVLEGVEPDAHMAATVTLHPVAASAAFDTSRGVQLVHEGVRVEIPADAVVDEFGGRVDGLVEISLVPFDPTQRRLEQPGPLQATRTDGTSSSLRSLGMAEISLWRDGMPLQLAPGAKARIELPLPASLQDDPNPDNRPKLGDQIEAWWFDLDAGVWREEGVGVVVPATERPGELAWTTEVAHFTWWNVDEPWTDHSCLLVTVHEDGVPKPGIVVQVVGDWGESQPKVTDANGEACTAMKLGETGLLYVGPKNAPLVPPIQVKGAAEAAACDGNGEACIGVPVDLVPGEMECTPGASYTCKYEGPPGTEDVGICKAGTRFCNGQGKWDVACMGQVVPMGAEDPNTPEDDDCDGFTDDYEGAGCLGEGLTAACYDGAPGTLGVGECTAGEKKCIVDGNNNLVWGPCIGAIPPDMEVCASPFDEDCDGNPGCGEAFWALNGGDAAAQVLSAVAVGSDGDVFVLGRGAGTMKLGAQSVDLGPGQQTVLGHILPDGTVVGLVSLGPSLVGEHELVVRGNQQVFVSGSLAGPFSVPGCDALPGDVSDGVLIELDGLACKKTRVLGGAGPTIPSAVAVGGDRVYVAGNFGGTLFSLMTTDTQDDVFVLGFDATDIAKPVLLAQQFAATWPSDTVNRPALAATTNGFAMAFPYGGIVTLTGKNFVPPNANGSTLLALFDPNGVAQWAADLGDYTVPATTGYAIALDAGGAVTVAADHGAGLEVSQWLDPDAPHWKASVAGGALPLPSFGGSRLAAAGGGRVVLSARKMKDGVQHAYMHKWTADGVTDWSHTAGDPGLLGVTLGLGVAVSPKDQSTYVTGRITSDIVFPVNTPITIDEPNDAADGYVAKLQP